MGIGVGDRFGRGVVVEVNRQSPTPSAMRRGRLAGRVGAVLLCDCGNRYVSAAYNLARGNTRSCGCLNREVATARVVDLNVNHGMSNHPLFRTWVGMRKRCENPSNVNFRWYGGRGVRLHPLWRDPTIFISFIETVLGEKPDPTYTLDRIDSAGDYEPGNVRWASKTTQARNRIMEKV